MKQLLFFVTTLFIWQSSVGQSQSLFPEKEYDDVLLTAKKEHKPIVIMVYATWCEHCKKMKSSVFSDEKVSSFYTKTFVCMAVDGESSKADVVKSKLAGKYKIQSFPSFIYLDENENYLDGFFGEMTTDKFLEQGKNVLLAENQFTTLKKSFYADFSNADNCLKYIAAVRKAGFDATFETQKYIRTQQSDSLLTEKNWRILANGINDSEAPEFRIITDNQQAFAKVVSPIRVERKIVFMVQDNLKKYAERGDSLTYNRKRKVFDALKMRKVDSLLYRYDIQLYGTIKDWNKYRKVALEKTELYGMKDQTLLIDIAKEFLNRFNDEEALEKATRWTAQSIQLSETYDKYLQLAKLHLKRNHKAEALNAAEKGKALANSAGWNAAEADKLISELNPSKP